jgi:hypothetical protein
MHYAKRWKNKREVLEAYGGCFVNVVERLKSLSFQSTTLTAAGLSIAKR